MSFTTTSYRTTTMSRSIPTSTLTLSSSRPSLITIPHLTSQTRSAHLLRRPKRPYTFTQLIALSDGSTYLHRTTSPAPVYRSTRDTRNSPLWNPSSQKLQNMESDEAGRLAAFRSRFGRGWDAAVQKEEGDEVVAATEEAGDKKDVNAAAQAKKQQEEEEWDEYDEEEENLLDLISSFGQEDQAAAGKKKK